MANEITVDPQQLFQEFFKKEKYRQRIAQLAISGKNSIVIDFEELYGFDQPLAEMLLNKPEEYLQHAGKGAYEQLRIEDAEYAEKIEKIIIRIVGLLGKNSLESLAQSRWRNWLWLKASWSEPHLLAPWCFREPSNANAAEP